MKTRLMSSILGCALMAIAHGGAAHAAPVPDAGPDALYEVQLCTAGSCETIQTVVSASSATRYFRGTTFPLLHSISVETDSAGKQKPAEKEYQEQVLGVTVELQHIAASEPGGTPLLRYFVNRTAPASENSLGDAVASGLPIGISTASRTFEGHIQRGFERVALTGDSDGLQLSITHIAQKRSN